MQRKKQKKPIFELYEGNEIKNDGIYDENGELICSYDDKVILDYFYYHQGWFWNQNDLSIVPSPKGFGYRGWNYLSKVKKHGMKIGHMCISSQSMKTEAITTILKNALATLISCPARKHLI